MASFCSTNETSLYSLPEGLLLEDKVVARGNDDVGIIDRAAYVRDISLLHPAIGESALEEYAFDMRRGVCDTGGCIAACRFAEHLGGLQVGYLLQDKLFVLYVGNYEYVFRRYDGAEAVDGHL